MAHAQYRTLSKRVVDHLSVNGKDAIFWDHDLAGFGVRVYPSGKKVFVVQTRAFGRSKRVTLGRHGDITTEIARKNATAVIARIKKGQPAVQTEPEPVPDPTVADLAERYQREYVEMHCKPATVSHYRLMLRKHIVPALGERLVADIEHKDILAFHNKLHRMPTVANRAADILVKMFNLADAWRWRPSGTNPCRGVSRFKVEKHERFLTREELYRLGPDAQGRACRAAGLHPCGGRHPPPRADRMPAQRNPRPALGRPELRDRRDAVARQQDWRADGAASAQVGRGVRRPLPHPRQSLGVPGQEEGHASGQSQRLLGPSSQARRSRWRPPA